jgi:hypothetical protein
MQKIRDAFDTMAWLTSEYPKSALSLWAAAELLTIFWMWG